MSDKKIVSIGKNKRNTWIDGLKGIACFQVFFNHFMCSVYPAYYMSGDQPVHTNGFEKWLAYSPLNMLFEGEMFVAIFCLVSGIFLTYKVMKLKDDRGSLSEIIVGRYFRLVLPVVPVGILVFIFNRIGLFTNVAASAVTGSKWLGSFYDKPIGFFSMLASVFIKTWFYGDDMISTAFWMLPQMFIGSFLAILLGAVYWRMKKKAVFVYAFVCLALIPRHDYVLVFAIGAIFAWMMNEDCIDFLKKIDPSGNLSIICGVAMVLMGHLVAGYPIQLEPQGIYRYMNCGFNDLWRVIGGVLLVFGVWNVPLFQKILSVKPLKFMGENCYEFYLIHIPILFSAGTGMFLLMVNNGIDYNVSGVISFFASFAFTIICAKFYSKYVSAYCAKVEKKIIEFFKR